MRNVEAQEDTQYHFLGFDFRFFFSFDIKLRHVQRHFELVFTLQMYII